MAHNHSHPAGQEACGCLGHGSSSVQQSMGEMEFERGIWLAACDGEDDRVQKFLSQGVSPDARDSSGLTALHYAARNGHVAVCRALISKGADVNAKTRSGGATALHRAAYRGHLPVVRLLVEARVMTDIRDSDGQTALHKAAEGARKEVIKFLVSKNNDLLEIKDNRDRLPKDCLRGDDMDLANLLTPT